MSFGTTLLYFDTIRIKKFVLLKIRSDFNFHPNSIVEQNPRKIILPFIWGYRLNQNRCVFLKYTYSLIMYSNRCWCLVDVNEDLVKSDFAILCIFTSIEILLHYNSSTVTLYSPLITELTSHLI